MVTILNKDILWATDRHKNLKYDKDENILKGMLELDFSKCETRKVDNVSFNVEINFNHSPKRSILPIVKAIGNEPELILKKIKKKNLNELHIESDRKICLCMPEMESEYFNNNEFDIKTFFLDILERHVYWINYYGNTKHKLPDYSHGILGCFELFAEDGIKFDNFCKIITKQKGEDKNTKLGYIIRSINNNKPLNFKKHKLRAHNKCLNKDGYLFRDCVLIHKAIRKINIEIKKEKKIRDYH